MAIALLLSVTAATAQIKNTKTETVKIFGNCGMCETNIEKAGSLNKVAMVDWNKDSKMATITYDAKKTNSDEILKRIALAGYDNEKFLAPVDVYDNLHGCCQYDREAKLAVTTEESKTEMNHDNHSNHTEVATLDKQEVNQLKTVFDNYFLLKDALVKSDGVSASAVSKDMLVSLNDVKMNELSMDVHMVWMKVMKDLKTESNIISETQDVKKQRSSFTTLSKNMYELIKAAKYESPVYYQFCPMANGGKGANWLSKENAVKNPYYGSQMMTCGKTVETIK
ncbi:Copper chaperone CopZ [Flavobacterium gillisiae]|uniref:Copper chaperone CopZ n=2 Tax=Flavobacterium gillisiae TaxID=150146 RepID=A0A1H3WT21_9FLAO|nr:Copper chaperone CopZ [Flavobacterium gillisiae]